jgi:chromatin structure-remodeling complex subunit RSC1/2
MSVCPPAKHFDRDTQTGELLWFSAPPVNIARDPGPRHSLAYLHFLAKKRKEGGDEGADSKRPRLDVPPTMTELVSRVLTQGSVSQAQ